MVKEFITLREFRKRFREEYSKKFYRECAGECKKVDVSERDICIERCMSEKRLELEELAREIKWYESKLNFITSRSLRIFDPAEGKYILCFRLRNDRVLCMSWDPSNFRFTSKVNIIYSCVRATTEYCKREDESRNIHVEAEYCSEFDVSEYYTDDLVKLAHELIENFSDAYSDLQDCIDCFDGDLLDFDMVETYSSESISFCGYTRCDQTWRECDTIRCVCREIEVKPEVIKWEDVIT